MLILMTRDTEISQEKNILCDEVLRLDVTDWLMRENLKALGI
jgi:hypothetical protein